MTAGCQKMVSNIKVINVLSCHSFRYGCMKELFKLLVIFSFLRVK